MKYYLFLIFCLCFYGSCYDAKLELSLREISERKDRIFIIDIDDESDLYMGKRKKFRDSLIKMVDKIKKLQPSVIYLNNSFINSSGGEKEFAEKLNHTIATISTFELNSDDQEINFTEKVWNSIGTIIKGRYNKFHNQYYRFSGVNFPSFEIIRRSKAICASRSYTNKKGEIEIIYPFHEYGQYLFENCPVTIANEFIGSYKMKIDYDEIEGRFALYSTKDQRLIKYLNHEMQGGYEVVPIEFKTFRRFSGKAFLENEIQIDPGYIFIINTLDKSFKVPLNREISNSEVLASMVYTLLDLVSK